MERTFPHPDLWPTNSKLSWGLYTLPSNSTTVILTSPLYRAWLKLELPFHNYDQAKVKIMKTSRGAWLFPVHFQYPLQILSLLQSPSPPQSPSSPLQHPNLGKPNGKGCMYPRTPFLGPLTLGVWEHSLNIEMGGSPSPCRFSVQTAKGPYLGKSPFHFWRTPEWGLRPDLTWLVFTFSGVPFQFFNDIFTDMHHLGCMDLQNHSLAPPSGG